MSNNINIKNPFNAPKEKYESLYKKLKESNKKGEQKFLNSIKKEIEQNK